MRFIVKIESDNAAFADDLAAHELARILRRLADKLVGAIPFIEEGTVLDVNGNTVGDWTYRP